jgi:hypothetical protein
MSVFVCWSGDRSKAIAEALKSLLEDVFPSLAPRPHEPDPVFLSKDIEKGAEWFQAIRAGLDASQAGIVVLTHENTRNPWIHFEAGALATRLAAGHAADTPATISQIAGAALGDIEGAPRSWPAVLGAASSVSGPGAMPPADGPKRQRLFPLLHGVTAAEMTGPLAAYQATSTSRADMGRLMSELARLLRLETPSADANEFLIADEPWLRFERVVKDAAVPLARVIADLQSFFQRKTFDEPLHHCADQAWLSRYEGARVTLDRLKEYRPLVKAACAPYEHGLFEMLLSDLDVYAMAIQALLITPKDFRLGPQGELQMDPGIQTCCEDRRLAIKSITTRLLHPIDKPMTTAAVRFMAADTDEERKAVVHLVEGRIRYHRELAYEAVSSNRATRAEADCDALTRLMNDHPLKHDPSPNADGAELVEPLLQRAMPANERLMTFRASSWDLDRIFYYRLVYYYETAAFRWPEAAVPDAAAASGADSDRLADPLEHDLFCAARDVEMEAEKYRARTKGGSLMPLTYALAALHRLHPRAVSKSAKVHAAIASSIAVVNEELGDVLRSEAGRPIATLLMNVR